MLEFAHAILHVKAVDADARVITGIATTPTLDRQNHVLEPAGVTVKNPIPLLLHHDRERPIGRATLLPALADGAIPFEASIPIILEPGPVKDRVDEAWQSIKAKLLTGVSIGFRALGIEPRKDGGLTLKRTEICELSLVTIPANADATILTIKALDSPVLAALGHHSPGVSGLPVVRALKDAPPMTIPETITQYSNTRAAKAARQAELMNAAATAGLTLDATQAEEYDGLALEVKAIDAHLVRLREQEAANLAIAAPIAPIPAAPIAAVAPVPVVTVKSNLPKGTAFVRAACATLVCKGNFDQAAQYAKNRWGNETPEVELYLKAAVAAGNTTDATWAGPLVNQGIAADFLELLRPATILGKIPGLRNVPFNTKVPSQTAGGTYGWVGENKAKPVTKLAFGSDALLVAKAAGIIVLTEELVRLSNPSAEALVRADMIAGIAQFLDQQFIDPAVAAVAGVSPASITNGAPTSAATTDPLADVLKIIQFFATNNVPVSGVTIIMSEVNALALSFRMNSDGSPKFPGVGIGGGTYRGINIVTSQAAAGLVIGLQPALILYADDGGVTIDASREASVQMDSAPDSPALATTVLVSLWQNNLVGLRAERFVNWKRASNFAVTYLTAAAYPASLEVAAAQTEPNHQAKSSRA